MCVCVSKALVHIVSPSMHASIPSTHSLSLACVRVRANLSRLVGNGVFERSKTHWKLRGACGIHVRTFMHHTLCDDLLSYSSKRQSCLFLAADGRS